MLRAIAFFVAMSIGVSAGTFSRYAALLFYLWFAIFRPQEWVWLDVEQFRLSLVIGLLLVAPALATGVWPNLTHAISLWSVAFLLAGLIGQMHAYDAVIGWYYWNLLAKSVVVALLLTTIVNRRSRFVQTMGVMAGSLAYHSSKFGLGFLVGGGGRVTTGIGGALSENNAFGLAVARVMFLMLATAQNVRHPLVKAAFYAAVPLAIVAVISTFSRGGFLALSCGGLVYVLLQRRRLLALSCTAVAALLMFTLLPSSYVSRLETIRSYDEVGEESALGRLHYWRVALIAAEDNPLGIGFRNFEPAYDSYDFSGGRYGTKRSVHNSHLQVLVEAGTLGFIAWASLFATALRRLFRIRARSRDPKFDPESQHFYFTTANALIASLVSFLVGGTFGSEALTDFNWFTFGLVAALDRLPAAELAGQHAHDSAPHASLATPSTSVA